MEPLLALRQQEALVAIRLYSLLDNLINAFIPPETEITPGGYADDIFDDAITDDEKHDVECSICYNVLRDCRQCEHGHRFCASCIFVWSMQPAEFSDKCPVCRCTGDYVANAELNGKLEKRHVHCTTEGCNWRGYLGQFQAHGHKQYNDTELQEVERRGPTGSPLPSSSTFHPAADDSDNEEDFDDDSDTEDEAEYARSINGGISLNSSMTLSVPLERATGTYTVALRSTDVRTAAGADADAAQPASNALPAIGSRVQQASYAGSRPSSGRASARPRSRTEPTAAVPAAAAVSPRPPSLPRPEQPRSARLRHRDLPSTTPEPTPSADVTSRPSTARHGVLPPLSVGESEAAGQSAVPAIASPPVMPLALPIRRSLPIPQAARRPVAPTQPAALNSSVQRPPPSTQAPAAQQTAAPPPQPNSTPRRSASLPRTARRDAPTARRDASVAARPAGEPRNRAASINNLETSRAYLQNVRTRLFASRQQVATILGIIAFEMDGRRRTEQQAAATATATNTQGRSNQAIRQPQPPPPRADPTAAQRPTRPHASGSNNGSLQNSANEALLSMLLPGMRRPAQGALASTASTVSTGANASAAAAAAATAAAQADRANANTALRLPAIGNIVAAMTNANSTNTNRETPDRNAQ